VYEAAQNNRLENNTVTNNDSSGILLDIGSGNVVSNNEVNDNGSVNADLTDGIRINAGSTDNTIRDNRLKNNIRHDCHDFTSGPLNTWTNNRGGTSSPPGLCGKDHGDKGDKGHTESLLQLQPALRSAAAATHSLSPDQ
jgi:parallel beta-helix repeat protein